MFGDMLTWALGQIGRVITHVFLWFDQIVVDGLGAKPLLSGIFFIGVLGGLILGPIFGIGAASRGADSVSLSKRQEQFNKAAEEA